MSQPIFTSLNGQCNEIFSPRFFSARALIHGVMQFRSWTWIRRNILINRLKSSSSVVSKQVQRCLLDHGIGFCCFLETAEALPKLQRHIFNFQHKTATEKGAGTLLHVLHVCYSFRQKCSKLGTHTTQGLKNNFYFRCFSISSGPKPRITDEYFQFFWFFN
jgi:hypothetical protein